MVFCGVCLFVAAFVYFIIPETKNKTFMEISLMFSSSKSLVTHEVIVDDLKLRKLNGYGAIESSSFEFS
ncbi:hypothetical protein XELAEV_18003533mg [Xenopus laevis]|nr:hypothetical protein XELAEV_18003533mg [Xenopus laevis]